MTDLSSPLRTLAVKSAVWYGGTRLWSQLVSWCVTIVLARLLVPHDYGIFAIALSVLAFVELVQEFGLGTALIQRQGLTRAQVNAVFWVVAAISLVLTLGTASASALIARLYDEPALVWPLRLLCVAFFISSLGTVPYSLLTKAIDLRRRSLAEAIAATVSAVVALLLAVLGYGIGALVVGQLARALVLNSALCVLAGWRPGFDVDFGEIRGLLTFGVHVAGTHLVGTGTTALLTFLMTRLLGGTAVGLFAMAQSLTEAPNRLSTAIINQVSLPVFSRLQDDQRHLAEHFLQISKYLTMVSLPVQIGLALVAPDLVPLLLSAKWDGLIVPFQILCLGSAVVLSTLTCSPLLIARGRAATLFHRTFVNSAALTGATLIGAPFGLVGVVAARTILIPPLRLLVLLPALREMNLSFRGFLQRVSSPLLAAGVMVVAVEVVRQGALPHLGTVEGLGVSIVTGAIAYTGTLLLLDPGLTKEVRIMARDLMTPSRA